MELKGEIEKYTSRIGNFDIFFPLLVGETNKKISEEINYFNTVINMLGTLDICKTLLSSIRNTYFP